MTMDPVVRVVDDDPAVRDSLKWMLELAGHHVRVFESADALLSGDDFQRPGCLLLDVRLPGETGVELLEQLESRGCHLPTIVITGHADVPTVVRAFRGGALDFIEKPFDDELMRARVAQAIELDQSQRVARAERTDVERRVDRLTPREREVMDLVVAGHPNKRIAADLSISPKTVEAHRAHIMTKMEADSLAALVHMADTLRDP